MSSPGEGHNTYSQYKANKPEEIRKAKEKEAKEKEEIAKLKAERKAAKIQKKKAKTALLKDDSQN